MTIKDLAEKTGYGVATVSRVLNNHPNVSQKARQAIMQAVEESGFQTNSNAKQLKSHAKSILVVVKGTANEMFSEMVETIQNLVAKTHYPLYVDYMDEDANEVLRAIQLCPEKKPLGIMFLGGNDRNFRNDFARIDVPCVLVSSDGSDLPFENLSSVTTNDRQATRCAMDSLIAMGHRQFVIVGGDRETTDIGRLRFEGCLDAFRKHGIAFDEKLDYQAVRFSYQDGYDATQRLIAAGRNFTALFAAADVIAIGAIRALHNNGLRVPQDVSVMGFDGLPLGSFLVPQLSTVIQSRQEMARRGVEILIDRIENGGPACHEYVHYSLAQRESTRRLGD